MHPSDPKFVETVKLLHLLLTGSREAILEQLPRVISTPGSRGCSEVLALLQNSFTTEALQPAWSRILHFGLEWIEGELPTMFPNQCVFSDFMKKNCARAESVPLHSFEEHLTEAKIGPDFFRILDELLSLLCRLRSKLREDDTEGLEKLNSWIRRFIKQRTHCAVRDDPQADTHICYLLAKEYEVELFPTA